MLIALLVVLGVNLIVIFALAVLVVGHNRWLKRQAGEFAGAIRLSSGEVHGLGAKWKRGSGRWVRDVLVWNGAPMKLRSIAIGVDEIGGECSADVGEIKRLGEHPVVAELISGDAVINVAADAKDHDRLMGQADL